jgi:uncharacterized protein with HEPN domain
MSKNKLYIKHILDAIQEIEGYLTGIKTFKRFLANKLVQDGVIRQLEIIGEASKRLSKEIKEEYDNVLWKDICGMRDKLIHDYFGVDLSEVWETATNDLKDLKRVLENCLDE